MNDNKDVNPAATSSPAEDVNKRTASSAEQTPQTETTPVDKTEKQSNREALIAKLTANKEQVSEEVEPSTKPTGAAEGQPETGKNEPEPQTTEVAEPEPEADPSDAEIQHYSENAQKRIRQAIKGRKDTEAKLKESEGLAGFGADILGRAQSANIPPQMFVDWVDAGVDVYRNPAEGAKRLVKMAESLGYKAQATLPDVEPLLKKLEEELEISPEAAKILRSRLKPAEAPNPPPQAHQHTQVQQPPQIDQNRLVMDKAARDMNQLGADFAKAHGAAWPEIEKIAAKRLEAYRGAPPALWPNLFKDAVSAVVAERKAADPTKSITRTLRPTTAPPGKEAPKSNRERVLSKYT